MGRDESHSSARTARRTALINAILGFGVAAFISLDADPFSNLFEIIAGPALALLGAVYFGRALSSKPEFEVRRDGIVHRCSRFPGELLIPWDQIVDADPGLVSKDVVVKVESRRALLPFATPFRKLELLLGGLAGRSNSLALRPPLGLKRSEFIDLINSRTLEAERNQIALPGAGSPAPP